MFNPHRSASYRQADNKTARVSLSAQTECDDYRVRQATLDERAQQEDQ